MPNYLVQWAEIFNGSQAADAARYAIEKLRSGEAITFHVRLDQPGKRSVPIIIGAENLRKETPAGDRLVEDIIQAAQQHGEESEPDHEVGDLQDALRLAWIKLSPEAQRAVHKELADGTIYTWMEVKED